MSAKASCSYYLLKAEPDSRVVKGKDVKFSVDDFEQVETSPWEGVRNFEARNIMQEMKVGDKALFYHSNCKNPGIAAFAEVSKEAYPDYTAWDQSHPYFDPKTDEAKPKWFMVDLTFKSRPTHFVPLALLKYIATSKSGCPVTGLDYLSEEDVQALRGMDLVTRGRLSVQRVREPEWNAVHHLAENGGWEDWDLKKLHSKGPTPVKAAEKPAGQASKRKIAHDEDADGEEAPSTETRGKKSTSKATSTRTRKKTKVLEEQEEPPLTDVEGVLPKKRVDEAPTPPAAEGLRRSSRNRR